MTNEGKIRAKEYNINDLKINISQKWDNKWRLIIFDIKDNEKIKREALRRKLKELNFYQLQKSVWIHPFDCHKEFEFSKDFLVLIMIVLNLLLPMIWVRIRKLFGIIMNYN